MRTILALTLGAVGILGTQTVGPEEIIELVKEAPAVVVEEEILQLSPQKEVSAQGCQCGSICQCKSTEMATVSRRLSSVGTLQYVEVIPERRVQRTEIIPERQVQRVVTETIPARQVQRVVTETIPERQIAVTDVFPEQRVVRTAAVAAPSYVIRAETVGPRVATVQTVLTAPCVSQTVLAESCPLDTSFNRRSVQEEPFARIRTVSRTGRRFEPRMEDEITETYSVTDKVSSGRKRLLGRIVRARRGL